MEFDQLRQKSPSEACQHFIKKRATLAMLKISGAVCTRAQTKSELLIVLTEMLGDLDFDHFFENEPSASSPEWSSWNTATRKEINRLQAETGAKLVKFKIAANAEEQANKRANGGKTVKKKGVKVPTPSIQNWGKHIKSLQESIIANSKAAALKGNRTLTSGQHVCCCVINNLHVPFSPAVLGLASLHRD